MPYNICMQSFHKIVCWVLRIQQNSLLSSRVTYTVCVHWMCCVALPCCLFDLACFFSPSFSSLINMWYILYVPVYIHNAVYVVLPFVLYTQALSSTCISIHNVSIEDLMLTTQYVSIDMCVLCEHIFPL